MDQIRGRSIEHEELHVDTQQAPKVVLQIEWLAQQRARWRFAEQQREVYVACILRGSAGATAEQVRRHQVRGGRAQVFTQPIFKT